MNAFDRYTPFIQDFIYSHDWESLRSIQVAAADAIFNTQDNVLLTASTASGKTEAAFFPILTEFWENPPASVGALYIGPLKALINDQFVRLNDLCEEADIPVWHWHGDVSQSHKAKLIKKPSGILQITPESLEALLIHKHMAIPRMFCDLRYVVIDEVHSLMRGDRGGQTLCLIERLSRMAGVQPRRIGLSATIGDPERTGAFLSQGTGRDCVIPRFEEPRRVWRISMEHFYNSGPQAQQRGFKSMGPQEAEVLACERIEAAAPAALPSAPKTCAIADNSHRRNAANVASRHGARLPPRTVALPRPPRAKSTFPEHPNRHYSTPPTQHQTTPTPAWAISSNTPAAASAWSLPTRAKRRRPYAPCCVATAKVDTSPTVSSSITAIFRHRCVRRQKSLCATRNRHRRPLPPLRWNSVSISAVWSVRFRSMRRLPSAPFCS